MIDKFVHNLFVKAASGSSVQDHEKHGKTINTDGALQTVFGNSQAMDVLEAFKKRSGDPVIARRKNQAKAVAK